MSKRFTTTFIAFLIAVAALSGPVSAQGACPGGEGRMADGKCVNPALASAMRQRGVLMNQLKISQTALPVPAHQDNVVPRATQFNRFELGDSGNFSVNPDPRSP